MWLLILILSSLLNLSCSQDDPDFPEPPDFPDDDGGGFPDFDFPNFDFPDFSDFQFPCSCKQSRCDCCLNVIIAEGCIRVALLRNNRIRVSFRYNGEDIGGFSTRLGTVPFVPVGVRVRVPCMPNTNVSLRLKNSRLRNNRRRFCINLFAQGRRRVLKDQDFCFDINGNILTNIGNNM